MSSNLHLFEIQAEERIINLGGISMDYLYDRRGNCMSIMITLKYPIYSQIIECAYKNRGGIEGQRGALKSSTAIRIRKRMIEDISRGAVLPPVVIGAAIEKVDFGEFTSKNDDQLTHWLIDNAEALSLIDGMQRTTAMMEAAKDADLSEYRIRIEIWLTQNVNNLIYRMLVLNSGQVPWDIKRQLETVFSAVLKQIQINSPEITIFTLDEKHRRRSAKQYQASDILELYLVFGSRKEKIDIKERLSDEFVRLDFMDLASNDDSIYKFSQALSMMAQLDSCFSRISQVENSERFQSGIEVFNSQPARVGFITSTAILMLGRPGSSQGHDTTSEKWETSKSSFESLLSKLEIMPVEDLSRFLALPMLSEKLTTRRSSKVGDYEREFYKEAFTVLYKEGVNLDSFEVCWNAY